VLLLALAWVALDALAVHVGLKEAATPPTAREMVGAWNAWVNVLVIAPILEELLFRGLFWSALERAKMRAVHVWVLSATAFAALHLPGWFATQAASPSMLGQLGLVFLAGLYFGAGRWLTGSAWPAALLHLVNNLASTGVIHG
jgi:membrane protease YdiL (CAAX protease family)